MDSKMYVEGCLDPKIRTYPSANAVLAGGHGRRKSSAPRIPSISVCPSSSPSAKGSSSGKNLASFRAAEKAGKAICVCGASAHYERERFALSSDKEKFREEQNLLKAEIKEIKRQKADINDERGMLDSVRRSLNDEKGLLDTRAEKLDAEMTTIKLEWESIYCERKRNQKALEKLDKEADSLKATRSELDERSRRLDIKNASIESKNNEIDQQIKDHEEKLAQFKRSQSKLQSDQEKVKQLRSQLDEHEQKLKTRQNQLTHEENMFQTQRQGLSAMEDRLHEQLSAVEDRANLVVQKEVELEISESDLRKKMEDIQKRSDQIEAKAKDIYEFEATLKVQQKDLDSKLRDIDKIRASMLEKIEMDKADAKAMIDLEKEWIQQEKENIDVLRNKTESELEKANAAALKQLENAKIKDSKELEKQKEEIAAAKANLSSLQEELKVKTELAERNLEQMKREYDQISQHKSQVLSQEQIYRTNQAQYEQEVLAFNNYSLETQKRLDERTLKVQELEAKITSQQSEVDQISRRANQLFNSAEEQSRYIKQKEKHVAEEFQVLASKHTALQKREIALQQAESHAKWLQDLYQEIMVKQNHLKLETDQLEADRKNFNERIKLLERYTAKKNETTTGRTGHFRAPSLERGRSNSLVGRKLPTLQTTIPEKMLKESVPVADFERRADYRSSTDRQIDTFKRHINDNRLSDPKWRTSGTREILRQVDASPRDHSQSENLRDVLEDDVFASRSKRGTSELSKRDHGLSQTRSSEIGPAGVSETTEAKQSQEEEFTIDNILDEPTDEKRRPMSGRQSNPADQARSAEEPTADTNRSQTSFKYLPGPPPQTEWSKQKDMLSETVRHDDDEFYKRDESEFSKDIDAAGQFWTDENEAVKNQSLK